MQLYCYGVSGAWWEGSARVDDIPLYIIGKGKSLFAMRKPPFSHSQNNNSEFSSLNEAFL